MLPTHQALRFQIEKTIATRGDQGHEVTGLKEQLDNTPDSYDALWSLVLKLRDLPLRPDWPYIEPSEWDAIVAEAAPDRPLAPIASINPADAAARVEAGFLASVCGCQLGKPLEINPTLDEIRNALTSVGEWPMNDYISERAAKAFPRPPHGSWVETTRERLAYAAPDDDINYTILGMLILEQHGPDFTQEHLAKLWLHHLPISTTFGPERHVLLRAGLNSVGGSDPIPQRLRDWVTLANFNDELCGAVIRADAYGYACPGNPALAAQLAWRDAAFTHRRTGIYGTMFVAAAIAAALATPIAPVGSVDRLAPFDIALKFIPQRSRFHGMLSTMFADVAAASDWLDAYQRMHAQFSQYTHCRVYLELGTLMNTFRFASSVGDGICKQVSQGNDTDSFGATAGSLLGCAFGPGHLEPRWLAPLHDDLHTALAWFYERSIAAVAKRMGRLPALVANQIAAQSSPPAQAPASPAPGAEAGI